MSIGAEPLDDNAKPIQGWDAGSHAPAVPQITTTSVDPDGVRYGALSVTGSITASNPSVGTDGSAAPTSATEIGASDGTNLQPLQVDGSKNLKVVDTNSAADKADLDAINTATSGAKSDLDTTVTDLAELLTDTDNLSGSKTDLDNVSSVEGATTDAAVTGDTNGTISGKLRGMVKILTDIWDSVNHRIKVDGSGVTQPVSGTVNTLHGSAVDASNSSTSVLAGNAAFTGAWVSSLNYSAISVEAYSDHASAASGLQIEQSQDGTNADTIDSFTVAAATNFQTTVNLTGQYYRIVYTNGATLQTVFRLQVVKQTSEVVLPRTLTALGNLKAAIQEALPAGAALIGAIMRSAVAVYSLASTTTSGSTQNSGDLTVGPYTEVSIDINTTAQAGTSPTIQYFWERKGADGIYYVLWQSTVLTASANTVSTSVGSGMAYNQSLGATGRIRWAIGGSATPTFTHSINVQGK